LAGRYFAHSTDATDQADWQPLAEHLQAVARLAALHAAKIGAGAWGELAGLLHDAGKYSQAFQERLCGGSRVDHATAGAWLATQRWPAVMSRPLQFVVAGHHAGLADGDPGDAQQRVPLSRRLSEAAFDGISKVTLLDALHSVYGAILRDSLLNGEPFMSSKTGKRLAKAEDASALLEVSLTALLLGTWDSIREDGELGTTFARYVVSKIVGVNTPVEGVMIKSRTGEVIVRTAGRRTRGRIDPLGILWSVEVFRGSRNSHTSEDASGEGAAKVRPSAIDPHADKAWYQRVCAIVGLHPGLSEGHKKAVKTNYGMTGDVAVIDVCISFLWYFLKRFGIDGDAAAKLPRDQCIVLLNREEGMAALASRHDA
jgi:hypothetical protein